MFPLMEILQLVNEKKNDKSENYYSATPQGRTNVNTPGNNQQWL